MRLHEFFNREDVLAISKDAITHTLNKDNPKRQGNPKQTDYLPVMKAMLRRSCYRVIVLDMNANGQWVKFFIDTVESCDYRVTDVICMQPDADMSFSEKQLLAAIHVFKRTGDVPERERSTMPFGQEGYDILRKNSYWTSPAQCLWGAERLRRLISKEAVAEGPTFIALAVKFPRIAEPLVECIEVDESWRDVEFGMELFTLKGEPDGNVPKLHALPEEMPREWVAPGGMISYADQNHNHAILLGEEVTRLAKGVARNAIAAALAQDDRDPRSADANGARHAMPVLCRHNTE